MTRCAIEKASSQVETSGSLDRAISVPSLRVPSAGSIGVLMGSRSCKIRRRSRHSWVVEDQNVSRTNELVVGAENPELETVCD